MSERALKDKLQILHQKKNVTPQGNSNHQETGKQLDKDHLVNKLNFTNFKNDTILINFKHERYDRSIMLRARPKPCLGNTLDCLWAQTDEINEKLHSYKFNNFFVIDGAKLLSVTPEVSSMNNEGISFILPETCYEINSRKVTRHSCEGINVQLIQNSSFFYGSLIDFNAVSFCIELAIVPPQTFQWLDENLNVNIILSNESEALYAGKCKILKNTGEHKTRRYILEPIDHQIKRHQQRERRSKRQKITPLPDIIFRHPFTKIMITLKTTDISGSGFSVEEEETSAVLLPGMIIPELELNFAGIASITCKAQVLYRQNSWKNQRGKQVKCGIAVLDMLPADNMKLLSILHQAKQGNSYVGNRVDMDALWDFFFETGFIYPDKYKYIQKNKRQIKNTYKKLYTQHTNIARHLIYQDKNRILGHMAMLRFYGNTWMIHHHAARKSALNRAGLVVLDQTGDFLHNCYRLYSLHMDYITMYYRTENKFPSRVFGGTARYIKDPKKCSVDDFAYFHYQNTSGIKHGLSEQWKLAETQREDLEELKNFYENESGGLMIHALDLEPETDDFDQLVKEYQRYGLKRERFIFSLKRSNDLKAILMANISDIGLNLSNLTSCIKVIILDSSDLPKEVLYKTLLQLTKIIEHKELPVLLYPVSYAEKELISYKKIYTMWILKMQYVDRYFSFAKRLLRFD